MSIDVIHPPVEKYFESYEDLEVHRLMLGDKPRTEAYRDAILSQKQFFKDKIVMDVGAGTGILSVFCAQAGAKKVYAIEASSVANLIPSVAKENKFEDVIQVLHCRVEDARLPPDLRVDVIVSEWMGFYLLHEGMLDSVIFARDRYLKPNGKMFPQSARMWAAPCSLPAFFDQWDDVCGVKMTAVGERERKLNAGQPKIVTVEACDLLTIPTLVSYLDLQSVATSAVDRVSKKTVAVANREGKYQGMCITFECTFPFPVSDTESSTVVLSTATDAPPTHWKQTAIVFERGLEVQEGEPIAWELSFNRNKDNPRHYDIQLEMLDPEKEEHTKPCGCYMTKCIVIKAFLEQLEENSSDSDKSDEDS